MRYIRYAATAFFLLLMSCQSGLTPVDFGHDACAHCRMTIIDKRYAAELITAKGKAFKFDDIICLLQYQAATGAQPGSRIFVAGYNTPEHSFMEVQHARFLHNESYKTPMNGNYAAFPDTSSLKEGQDQKLLKWDDLLRLNR
ncbi:hypothetical protein [Chitinophaga sp. 212800010-3]|uniref:nitrous oxide reductase accessory protein NosL n=1 Tax=unclassified Chitinophaga TaxID=2619133 RepID=UPI002DF0BDFC|nr:Nitrous oxide reductase accessory protein NosL [Chitinophaga sp. 212800010-3]